MTSEDKVESRSQTGTGSVGPSEPSAVQKFITEQLRKRQWLRFPEIVEEVRRQRPVKTTDEIYPELAASFVRGEFDIGDQRSITMTMPDAYEERRYGPLANCWLPATTARRWMERRGYVWPPHFDPECRDQVAGSSLTTAREDVIREKLKVGMRPGKDIAWQRFCDAVRDECDGWIGNRKDQRPARGFSDKSIQRLVKKAQPTSLAK